MTKQRITKDQILNMYNQSQRSLRELKAEYDCYLDEVLELRKEIEGHLSWHLHSTTDNMSNKDFTREVIKRFRELEDNNTKYYRETDQLKTEIAFLKNDINRVKAQAFDEIMKLKGECNGK